MNDRQMVERLKQLEQEASTYRQALYDIAAKAATYKQVGNGQGSVLYSMAMSALFGRGGNDR